MVDISVITFTMGGRDKYLETAINDIYMESLIGGLQTEHHVVFQGCRPTASTMELVNRSTKLLNHKIHTHHWPENIGIAAGLNKVIPECKGDLLFKMDDDCKVISWDLFANAWLIHKKFPNSCFSPYPCGLIGNPGGPRGFKHSVWFNKDNDKVYTRRHVSHLGGFARFSPKSIIEKFTFPNDLIPGVSGTEDGEFSKFCNANGIEMFYLENEMIVEHSESTLGQIVRYKEYFKNRSYEGSISVEVIE